MVLYIHKVMEDNWRN